MRTVPWDFELPRRCAHIIDVRSPGEYGEDHIPGAVNLPVLDDAEREEVGTIYCQECAFKARRIGAAMVARNIAWHLEHWFSGVPQDAPLLFYCARGGLRSRAMATVIGSVGWTTLALAGGYKAFRQQVREQLAQAGDRFAFRVVAGLTGSGKSRLLRALQAAGEQVLDLELLASHRGSLLGQEPGRRQPTQKAFETQMNHLLLGFDPSRPVWVESESKRVGCLHVPETVWQAMLRAPVLEIRASVTDRAALLCSEYSHFIQFPDHLLGLLPTLVRQHGHRRVQEWKNQVVAGKWQDFAESMLVDHYDPAYRRAYPFQSPKWTLAVSGGDDASLLRLALECVSQTATITKSVPK